MLTLVAGESIFESLDRLSASVAPRPDVRTLLDGIGPSLMKIMQADRGFIRLFPGTATGAFEDLGHAGLTRDVAIGVTKSAFIRRLLAGRYVRDGHTLLVPIIRQDCTIGFFYLDRHLASRPFTDADGHLLTGVGQALMTLTSIEG